MRRKTYYNFMRVKKMLQEIKHYSESEASKLAHLVFENVENDKGGLNRTAEAFVDMILTAEEYAAAYPR